MNMAAFILIVLAVGLLTVGLLSLAAYLLVRGINFRMPEDSK